MTGRPLRPADWAVSAVSPDVSEAGHAAILAGLIAHDEARIGPSRHLPVCVYVTDEGGAVVGGLQGRTFHGWLIVEMIFVPERGRGQGLGARVLREAEAEAVRRGCRAARLETGSYQARGFYEKQGYTAFGDVALGTGDHRLIFMSKDLVRPVG